MNLTTEATVIVGGGFAGLFTALHLSHQRYCCPIVLIDPKERFVFKPILYELLSGEMSDNQVSPRYQDLLDGSGVTFIQDCVEAIELQQKQVMLASGLQFVYDKLVLTAGSAISHFGVEGAKDYAFSFRTDQDVIKLRRHLRECLQLASQTQDLQKRRQLLTVAIVGAGPAGVEMSATLADLLPRWYLDLGGNAQEIRVVLLSRGQEILKGDVNQRLQETAMKALQQRTVPVELLLEASAKAVYPDRLEYLRHDQTETLSAATVIWTVGNMTHPLIKTLSVAEEGRDRQGRLLVTPTLQLPQFPDVFAAGDCSSMEDNPQPPTAQVAYQQGSTIAYNLRAIAEGKPLKPANVSMRGTLMKLGLGESAANLVNRFEIKGKVGHLIRQGTYLELLPTPVHNFKATTQWLTDEIFDSYARLTMNQRIASVLKWSSGTAAAIAIASSGLFAWRLAAPNQFNQALESTGIPALVDRLLLGQESSPDLLEELEKSN